MNRIRKLLEQFVPACPQEETDRRLMLQYCDVFPELLTRRNEMAHMTASCWIVNPGRDRVLMAYHNLYRSWSWLGGHADGDDDLLRVAMKEACEESGLTQVVPIMEMPVSIEILGVDGHVKKGKYVASHLHLNVTYLLECDDTLPVFAKPDENSAVRWFSCDEVLSFVTEPEMLPIYEKLLKKVQTL